MIFGLLILSICILWPLSVCLAVWLLGLPKRRRFEKLVQETLKVSPLFSKQELQELMEAVEKEEPMDHELMNQLQEMWYI